MTTADNLTGKLSFTKTEIFRDIFFLVVIILLSRILFVLQLGFYSDDWFFLEMYHFDKQNIWQDYRPIYHICWLFFYSVFGFSPDGYHILNTLLFFSDAILIYLILKKLRLHRIFYLSIPLVFIFLPHYSTIHFWASVIPNHLCLSLLLISLLFDLKALESDSPRFIIWKIISVGTIVVSLLTYELFLPFFYLNFILTAYYYKQLKFIKPDLTGKGKKINVKKLISLILINFISMKLALVYKLTFTETSVRMLGNETSITEHFAWLIINIFRLDYNEYDYGFNIKQSLDTNFIEYGIQIPDKLLQVYNYYPDKIVLFTGIIITLFIFFYLHRVIKKDGLKNFRWKTVGHFILAGIILFFWGYSIFLTNYSIAFTTTGVGNRVSIGAAIGIAVIWIGLITGITKIIKSEKFRNIFFSLAVAVLCLSGFIIINTISDFWERAYRIETEIIEEIKNNVPVLQDGTRFMLDGVCPYEGPAIVFEANWDLEGALRLAYSKKNLKADIIKPNLQITKEGLIAPMYGEEYFYPYDILIYNHVEKRSYWIKSDEEAQNYLESVNTTYSGGCPESHEAHGTKIFW